MNIRQLHSALAMVEGKKVQVSIGNVRELVAKLKKMIKDDLKVRGSAQIVNLLLPAGYALQDPGPAPRRRPRGSKQD